MRQPFLACGAILVALAGPFNARPAHAQSAMRVGAIRMPAGWMPEYHDGPRMEDRQSLLEKQFARATPEQLRRWATSENPNQALRASWELVRLVGNGTIVDGKRRFDPAAVTGFLELLADRLQVQPPDWWAELLRNATNTEPRRYDVFMRSISSEVFVAACPEGLIKTFVEGSHYICYGEASVRRLDNDLIVQTQDSEWTIRNGLTHLEELGFGDSICLEVIGERAVLANFDNGHVDEYRVACIKRDTGELMWKSDVWALGEAFYWSPGFPSHYVEIVAHSNRVAVFGTDPDGMYVEVFGLETGACLGRFCTRYVFVRD